MARLPVLSGKEVVKAFEKLGWNVKRRRGSHVILTKTGYISSLSVPQHKELASGTLRALIRNAEITVEEFVAIVKKKRKP